ncbi:hypothetical protein FGG08_000643 [Glutinoglossum americanum]|uniref:PNPLA domain-containing protein n=1 Tax=Glutinoglossum americanum TaxID=1670608 RepID=A0A9P8I8P5_9PEZI|nr:hypothetical protein FGG08_000643 [Glutinoglossum americanum]
MILFSIGSKDDHNKVHLRLVPGTMEARSPTFIADCELHNIMNFKRTIVGPVPGVIDQRSIRWLRNVPRGFDPNSLANLIYTKLISPFCTIICFFADDLGGTRATAKILASWLISLSNQSSDLPTPAYPRVLILKRSNDPNAAFDEKLATICFMQELRQETDLRNGSFRQRVNGQLTDSEFDSLLGQQFSDMRVLALPLHPGLLQEKSVRSQLGRLQARLLQESQDIQGHRRTAKVAFSANHFKAFVHSACDHFTTDILTPFSFVEASRVPNPVPRDLSSHLTIFLKHTPRKTLMSFTVPVIASALSLDSYPPDMHNFEPAQVFNKLYNKAFKNIQIDQYPHDLELFTQIRGEIENIFCQQVSANIEKSTDTATAHKAVLSQFQQWKTGSRCLSINGGSLQDIMSLKVLENELKLPMPIREHFDMGTGSGLGALLVLQIFCQEWSLDDCLDHSQATDTPENIPKSRFSQDSTSAGHEQSKYLQLSRFASRWREALPTSNQHSSSTIDSDLKSIFGKHKTLFECSANGTKIAVTATKSKDSLTCIFSNYNGVERKPRNHRLIRSEKLKDEMLIWQVSPKSSRGYQSKDLGTYNDLINLTLWEQDSIWSRVGKPPDIFICPGASIKGHENPTKNYSRQWLSRLQYNVKDTITSSLDGLLSSLFYIELIGTPLIDTVGFFCRAQIRSRLTPSQPAFMVLIERLRKVGARFYYDQKTVPCVNRQLYGETKRGIAFSRYIEFSAASLSDEIDVKIDGITEIGQSISNCPYMLQTLIEDQGLDCVFGHRDHKRRHLEV